MKKKVVLKGKVEMPYWTSNVNIEFGRLQCEMEFSEKGSIQRKLKLEQDDKVLVTVEKV